MLAEQNLKKIAAETEKMTAIIQAKQKGAEAEIKAETAYKVAEIEYKTAEAEARATMNAAEAERRVIAESNKKEAEVLAMKISAYGNGEDYIAAQLYAKIMPQIRSIMYNGSQNSMFGLPISLKPKESKPLAFKQAEPPKEKKAEPAPAENVAAKSEGGAE